MLDGLLIRAPWIDKILDGSKTWEIRGSNTYKAGHIGLIESGTGTVVGVAELVWRCRSALSEGAFGELEKSWF